jgi:ABC-type uncharacterized transport system permease subunit
MWSDLLEPTIIVSILAAGVQLATPYLFAAIGETIGQLSGVLNLGVEGIMLMAAFSAFYVTARSGTVALGLLVAIIVGAALGALMATACVVFNAQQGIAGIALYLIGLGLSDLLFQKLRTDTVQVRGVIDVEIPLLRDLPGLGRILFQHNLMTYAAFTLVPLAWYVIRRTTIGLTLKAVGENPSAADTVGLHVNRIRFVAVVVGGVFSGLAGASLSVALLNFFQRNMTAGIGFIAVALVYFGGWRPLGVLVGALLFSTINSLQLQIQTLGVDLPSEFTSMLPYVVTIVVLALGGRRQNQAPAALTRPYTRGA